jgi:hypothetical protein
MTILVVWTIIVAAAIALALASYLTAIAYYLYRAGGSKASYLAQLAGGLVAVRDNVTPLKDKVATVAEALAALRRALQAVDESLTEAAQAIRR